MDRRNEHLDPAMIASLVDKTIDPAARAAAEAHLAECADCREVWVETSEMLAEARGEATPANPRTSRRWIYGAAGLAAAAVIAIAVVPAWLNRGDRPELRELVEAVGTNRRTEARLTGGFQWGPVPSVTRGANQGSDTKVDLAVAMLHEMESRNRDVETIAAAGVAAVISGDTAGGVARLEEASRLSPSDAGLSDLSAALLEQARQTGDMSRAALALREADRALALNPTRREALFNRALALDYLGMRDEAYQAWARYLTMDVDSPWAGEAAARMRALRR